MGSFMNGMELPACGAGTMRGILDRWSSRPVGAFGTDRHDSGAWIRFEERSAYFIASTNRLSRGRLSSCTISG